MSGSKNKEGSLETCALQGVLKQLYELTSSQACSFTGSGAVRLSEPVRIAATVEDTQAPIAPVLFPGTEDLTPLTDVCSAASFGKGSKQVFDTSYRSALELNPTRFTTSFAVAQYDVLAHITRLTNPESACLTANLHKLNIYRPGDFFKRHLDTPRAGLLGSLVVCLPYTHTGGDLVVKHLGTSVTHAWGDCPKAEAQWAFFYSDCEHEVTEVTSGMRVTLTYNLYCRPSADPTATAVVNHGLSPLALQLSNALDSAAFLPNGGRLGFALGHLYAHTRKRLETHMLKGADAAVLAATQQLGLEAKVQPVWITTGDDDSYNSWDESGPDPRPVQPQGCLHTCEVPGNLLVGGPLLQKVVDETSEHSFGSQEALKSSLGFPASTSEFSHSGEVYWVTGDFDFQLGLVTMHYGNETSLDTYYSAAALIVTVPPFPERHSAS